MSNKRTAAPSDSAPRNELFTPPPSFLIRALCWAALFWLLVGLFAGLTYASQFIPGWGAEIQVPKPSHSPARIRMAHSTSMLYGFVLNVFLAAWIGRASTPRAPIQWAGFFIFEAALIAGVLRILYGGSRPLVFSEISAVFDVVLFLGFALLVAPALSFSNRSSSWDTHPAEAFVWLALVSAILLHVFFAPLLSTISQGARASRLSGFFGAQTINLFFLPLTLGVWLGCRWGDRPANSSQTKLIVTGWFGLVLFGPLAGAEPYVLPPVGQGLSSLIRLATLGQSFSILLLLPALFPFGRRTASPNPWFSVAWVFLILVLTQRLALSFGPLRSAVEFSEWMIGHHHLLFGGLLGFVAFGLIDEIWVSAGGRTVGRWGMLASLHFGLTLGGLIVMVVSLNVAGFVQSALWEALTDWSETIAALVPFWYVRLGAGCVFAVGQLFLFANLFNRRRRARVP